MRARPARITKQKVGQLRSCLGGAVLNNNRRGVLALWLGLAFANILFVGGAATAQTSLNAAQIAAQNSYQAYAQAHQNTINGYYARVPQDQFNLLLAAEVAAWTNYVQAQNAINAQAHLLGLEQQIANIDATIQSWVSYIQNLYNLRSAGAYTADAVYRAAFDNWVKQEAARGNSYIEQLKVVRAQAYREATTVVSQPIETPQVPWTNQCDTSMPNWCDIIYRNR